MTDNTGTPMPRRSKQVLFLVSGVVLTGLFPGCLVPLVPYLPLAGRMASNAIVDALLGLGG